VHDQETNTRVQQELKKLKLLIRQLKSKIGFHLQEPSPIWEQQHHNRKSVAGENWSVRLGGKYRRQPRS
jgi:hypothetical protein